MRTIQPLFPPALLIVLLWDATAAGAAGRVELELVSEAGAAITAQQEWLQRASEAGITNLRIRAGRAGDQVGIAVGGTADSPIYSVTGLITASGDVVVPGGRFRPGEARRLAQWLDELARLGPADQRPQKSAFGLTAPQFEQVHKDLAQPVGFSTKGQARRDVIQKIAGRLATPLRLDPEVLTSLKDDDRVAEELSELSCGTALAYVVRPLGMCLVPRDAGPRGLECAVTGGQPKMEAWPIGWEPEKRPGELVPQMFQFFNVDVQGATVPQVLEAVSQRLKLPVLLDYNALARHGVELEKAIVNLPPGRTSYTLLLRRSLAPAGLKSELRVDEAGKPLVWVTTLKPL